MKKKPWWSHNWRKITIDGEKARRCTQCGIVQYQVYQRWQQRFDNWEDAVPENRRCPKAKNPKNV